MTAPVAAKLAAVAAPEAVSVPVLKFPALAVLLMVIPVAELSRPTLAAPVTRRQRGSGHAAGGRERCAGNGARGVHARREHVRAVHVVAQQLVAAHVALRGEPQSGRAREGQQVGQQVRHGDRLSLEGAGPDLQAVQVQRARRLLHQPGDRPAEGAEVQLRGSARRRREVQARRAPDTLRGRAEEGAGDAHVVVVGRADVHHQVGGRAQPVPAAEGVASPRCQGVGAHDVPGEGHGVALQLEASHREAGHQKIAQRVWAPAAPRAGWPA